MCLRWKAFQVYLLLLSDNIFLSWFMNESRKKNNSCRAAAVDFIIGTLNCSRALIFWAFWLFSKSLIIFVSLNFLLHLHKHQIDFFLILPFVIYSKFKRSIRDPFEEFSLIEFSKNFHPFPLLISFTNKYNPLNLFLGGKSLAKMFTQWCASI